MLYFTSKIYRSEKMRNIKNKKRFSALIQEDTYNKVNEFVKNNELINTRLTPGTVLELGLKLFFEEVEKRPLENIASEYFIGSKSRSK